MARGVEGGGREGVSPRHGRWLSESRCGVEDESESGVRSKIDGM